MTNTSIIVDMRHLLLILLTLVMVACSSPDYSNFDIKRLDSHSNKQESLHPYTPRKIPRYDYSEEYPLYKGNFSYNQSYNAYGGLYPRYDPDADNQYPTDMQYYPPVYDYEYPTYDPDADNPYYPGQIYVPYDDQVYEGFYPTYDPDADNPYYPPPPSDTQFDQPMFDSPMFTN